MSISSVSSGIQSLPQANVNTAKVNGNRDSDGDTDGSHAGEVEKAAQQQALSSTSTLGSVINTTA